MSLKAADICVFWNTADKSKMGGKRSALILLLPNEMKCYRRLTRNCQPITTTTVNTGTKMTHDETPFFLDGEGFPGEGGEEEEEQKEHGANSKVVFTDEGANGFC